MPKPSLGGDKSQALCWGANPASMHSSCFPLAQLLPAVAAEAADVLAPAPDAPSTYLHPPPAQGLVWGPLMTTAALIRWDLASAFPLAFAPFLPLISALGPPPVSCRRKMCAVGEGKLRQVSGSHELPAVRARMELGLFPDPW